MEDTNATISAPTGSGKTVLFELCILRVLSRFLTEEGKFNQMKGTFKTVYVAPSKALVQEKLRDWNQKFGSLGISCLELTGDNESYNVRHLQEADIILTTPEKFDAVTRQRIWDGGLGFFGDISLLLIDEVHLLSDTRGAVLEAIVSRIKMLARNPKMSSSPLAHVRMIAVSATIPNIEDLGRFGEEMRPVKLTTKVFGYAPAKNDFLFEQRLQNFIFDILMQYSRGRSALVFCSTRKGAQGAAQRICQSAIALGYSNPFIKSHEQLERLKSAALSFSDKNMQTCIPYGVGYHNGGLCQKDRSLVEGLFLNGDLQILCTTNTLAHGINLPAHTVVIKSTQYLYVPEDIVQIVEFSLPSSKKLFVSHRYSFLIFFSVSNKEKGLYMEYDRSTVLQMCGRAGRPPFDDTGMVIIMTRRETVHLYENLLNGCEMVESQLLSCMTEHLNAEIVQLTVSDISLAIEWLKCSYLYVRHNIYNPDLQNPDHYGVKKGIHFEQLEKHMKAFSFSFVEPGKLMAKYYLKFGTMKEILLTSGKCSLEELLHVVCRSEEICCKGIQLRRNEKKLLNDINSDKDGRLRYHILSANAKRKKRVQSREEKIFVLINDCLTGDPMIHDLSLNQDVNAICSSGTRVAKCMKECFIFRKEYKGALHASILAKCLHHRLWDDSQYLLKQLVGIGLVTAKALHSVGVHSFDTLESADPRRIEIITGRKYPFGNQIKESLLSIPPKVEVKMEEVETRRQGDAKLNITLTRISSLSPSPARPCGDLVVGSEEDNQIVYHEKIRLNEYSSPYAVTIFITLPQNSKLTVSAHLISEEYGISYPINWPQLNIPLLLPCNPLMNSAILIVGRDIHEKLVLARSKGSSLNQKKAKKNLASAYSLPEGIYVVEDDAERNCQPLAEGTDIIGRPNAGENYRETIILSDSDSGSAEDLSCVLSYDINDTVESSYDWRDVSSFIQQSNSDDALAGRGAISPQRAHGRLGQPVKENKELIEFSSKSSSHQVPERTFPAEENSENCVEQEKPEGSTRDVEILEVKDVTEARAEQPCCGSAGSVFDVSFLGCRSIFSFL
ncbi:DExH-box ATP-dependent RNA helicase [Nymphaea thermarum]|nr:DExH-box ATP-dependent RNA helicase [Nymphaea thermarum]